MGVWEAVLAVLSDNLADTAAYSIDSTIVRGHAQTAGAKGGTQKEAFGRSRGGFTSKIHCLCDAAGRPLQFWLTGGEAADCKAYEALMELADRAPKTLIADKDYDSNEIRGDLKSRGIKPVIPPKSNRKTPIRL